MEKIPSVPLAYVLFDAVMCFVLFNDHSCALNILKICRNSKMDSKSRDIPYRSKEHIRMKTIFLPVACLVVQLMPSFMLVSGLGSS
jgi:hypothetical protein